MGGGHEQKTENGGPDNQTGAGDSQCETEHDQCDRTLRLLSEVRSESCARAALQARRPREVYEPEATTAALDGHGHD